MNTKKILYMVGAIIIIVALYMLFYKETKAPVVADRSGESTGATSSVAEIVKIEYGCDQGDVRMTFSGEDLSQAKVELKSTGEEKNIQRVVSASGTRYANTDETFVFWSNGTTAFITENDTTIYENCNEK